MTTTSFVATDTEYTLITSEDALVQNKTDWPMYVHFGDTLPAVDTEDYHILTREFAILKSGGIPSGNIYVRASRYNVQGAFSS